MRQMIKASLDRTLSGVEMTSDMKAAVLRKTATPSTMDTQHRRVRLSAALVAAIILVIALAALAVANRESLLRHLYRSEVAQQLVRDEGAVYEQDGIRVSVLESLVGPDIVAMTWEIESLLDEPVLIDAGRFPTLHFDDGTQVAIYDEAMVLLGGELDGKARPRSFTATTEYGNNAGDGASVPIAFEVYSPTAPIVLESGSRNVGDDGYMQMHPDDGNLYFEKNGVTVQWDYPAVRNNAQENISANGLFADAGYVKLLTAIDHTFEIKANPDTALAGTHIVGQNRFDFDRYTIIVREMNFAPTNTTIKMELYPKYPISRDHNLSYYGEPAESDPIWRRYALLIQEGEDAQDPSAYREVYGGPGTNWGGWESARNCISYHSNYQTEEIPTSVTVMPINNHKMKSGIGSEASRKLRAENYDIAESFTIELAPGVVRSTAPAGGTRIDGQTRFEFDDYTLDIDMLDFAPSHTRLRMKLYPKDEQLSAAINEKSKISDYPMFARKYMLLDKNGEDLMKDVYMETSLHMWRDTDDHWNPVDRKYVIIDYSYGAIESIPDEITIVPVNPYEWNETGYDDMCRLDKENLDMSQAVTVKVTPDQPDSSAP